jgi:hypothetical protein
MVEVYSGSVDSLRQHNLADVSLSYIYRITAQLNSVLRAK